MVLSMRSSVLHLVLYDPMVTRHLVFLLCSRVSRISKVSRVSLVCATLGQDRSRAGQGWSMFGQPALWLMVFTYMYMMMIVIFVFLNTLNVVFNSCDFRWLEFFWRTGLDHGRPTCLRCVSVNKLEFWKVNSDGFWIPICPRSELWGYWP